MLHTETANLAIAELVKRNKTLEKENGALKTKLAELNSGKNQCIC